MSTGQVWLTNTLGGTMWSPPLPSAARGGLAAGEVSAVRRCEGRRGAGQGQRQDFHWNVCSDLAAQGINVLGGSTEVYIVMCSNGGIWRILSSPWQT